MHYKSVHSAVYNLHLLDYPKSLNFFLIFWNLGWTWNELWLSKVTINEFLPWGHLKLTWLIGLISPFARKKKSRNVRAESALLTIRVKIPLMLNVAIWKQLFEATIQLYMLIYECVWEFLLLLGKLSPLIKCLFENKGNTIVKDGFIVTFYFDCRNKWEI